MHTHSTIKHRIQWCAIFMQIAASLSSNISLYSVVTLRDLNNRQMEIIQLHTNNYNLHISITQHPCISSHPRTSKPEYTALSNYYFCRIYEWIYEHEHFGASKNTLKTQRKLCSTVLECWLGGSCGPSSRWLVCLPFSNAPSLRGFASSHPACARSNYYYYYYDYYSITKDMYIWGTYYAQVAHRLAATCSVFV